MACRRNFVVSYPLIGQAALSAVTSSGAVCTESNLLVTDGCQQYLPGQNDTPFCAGCGCHEAFHDHEPPSPPPPPTPPPRLSGAKRSYSSTGAVAEDADEPNPFKQLKMDNQSLGPRELKFIKHFAPSKKRPVQCKVCCMCYPEQDKLQNHMKLHTQTKHLECHYCFKIFSHAGANTDEMMAHVASVHSRESNPWSCPKCGQKFSQAAGIAQHIRLFCPVDRGEESVKDEEESEEESDASEEETFEGMKGFDLPKGLTSVQLKFLAPFTRGPGTTAQCKVCLKVFHDRAVLPGDHAAMHSGSSKFLECIFCTKNFCFGQETEMLRHMAKTHAGNRLPFLCRKCNKQFLRRSDLTMHSRRQCL
jgi:hypothetical protein